MSRSADIFILTPSFPIELLFMASHASETNRASTESRCRPLWSRSPVDTVSARASKRLHRFAEAIAFTYPISVPVRHLFFNSICGRGKGCTKAMTLGRAILMPHVKDGVHHWPNGGSMLRFTRNAQDDNTEPHRAEVRTGYPFEADQPDHLCPSKLIICPYFPLDTGRNPQRGTERVASPNLPTAAGMSQSGKTLTRMFLKQALLIWPGIGGCP
jgi:hypothetical protein